MDMISTTDKSKTPAIVALDVETSGPNFARNGLFKYRSICSGYGHEGALFFSEKFDFRKRNVFRSIAVLGFDLLLLIQFIHL
jgi:hypothetical protein